MHLARLLFQVPAEKPNRDTHSRERIVVVVVVAAKSSARKSESNAAAGTVTALNGATEIQLSVRIAERFFANYDAYVG